jgi:hypothetical protein
MRHHFEIDLHDLSADQIIDLLDFLEGMIDGIWRVHGDELASHPRLGATSWPPDWSEIDPDRDEDDDDRDDIF